MRTCENCYYSKESMNKDLVACTYMNDIMEDLDTEQEWKNARYFTRLTNFNGDAFKAFVEINGEPVTMICVDKSASCGKWVEKRADV